MGRKSATKDRAYLTQSEHKEGYGGASSRPATASAPPASALSPWDRCSITGEPWVDPVCSPDGAVFDVSAAVPAIRESGGRHPLYPDEPLSLKDLLRLRYHRVGGDDGAPYGCPVTGKAFTPSSHIVAVGTTGNVYSYEAVDRLCLKAKNLKDLLEDTPFSKSDVVHLQDPQDASGKRAEAAARARARAGVGPPATASAAAPVAGEKKPPSSVDASALGKDARKILARISGSVPGSLAGGLGERGAGGLARSRGQESDPRLRAPRRENVASPAFKPGAATWATDGDSSQLSHQARKEAEKKRKREEEQEEQRRRRKERRDGEHPSPPKPYGDEPFKALAAAAAAASRPVAFTSSVTPLSSSSAGAPVVQPPKFRKATSERGYARLTTSHGDLNLELFADSAPRAVENFVTLVKCGYYDGCSFHRSVRNFVLQGGDPTGTGKGGESIYDTSGFPYEDSKRSHDSRGVVAMANAGDRDSNGSQFYVTYRSAPHLDGKHTVFGRVVGGAETTLSSIERVETDEADRPLVPVFVERATVFVDPFEGGGDDGDDEEGRATREAEEERERDEGRKRARWFSGPEAPTESGGGVGRYLAAARRDTGRGGGPTAAAAAPKKRAGGGFGDFSSW